MPEITFRIAGAVLSIVYMTIRTAFERKLGRPTKLRQFSEMGPEDRKELTVVGYANVPVWLYFVSDVFSFAAMGLPGWLRWTGAVLAMSGLALFAWTHEALAGNWSPRVETPRAGTLITQGPYAYVRHPMYFSFFLYNIGLLLLVSNWAAGVPALAAFAWMYRRRVGREERVMLETFGDDYVRYAEKTGRLIPGIGRGSLG